jgi:hypothetical protein
MRICAFQGHLSSLSRMSCQIFPSIALRDVALGDRLHSLLELSESGAPLVQSMYKQTLKYFQRARESRGAPVKDSLIVAAMAALNAPPMHYQSAPVAEFVE